MKSSRMFWVPSLKYRPLPRWKSLTTSLYRRGSATRAFLGGLGRGLGHGLEHLGRLGDGLGRLARLRGLGRRRDLRDVGDGHVVAGALLDVVHRVVGGVDQVLLRSRVIREERDPDRDGEVK